MSPTLNKSRGFSLIEMMVAMVVLSIGMLGIANLFVVTLQANSSATSRQLANNLLGDIADRIRSNRTAIAAYAAAGANNNCAGSALGRCLAPVVGPDGQPELDQPADGLRSSKAATIAGDP